MGEFDPATAGGHLDTDTWDRTDRVVVAHEPGPHEAARFAVVCHACGWAVPASSAADGHAVGEAHDCEAESRPATSTALLRRHLGLP